MPILTRKNLAKLSRQNCQKKSYVSNFVHFQDEMDHLFFLQNEALSNESFKLMKDIIH